MMFPEQPLQGLLHGIIPSQRDDSRLVSPGVAVAMFYSQPLGLMGPCPCHDRCSISEKSSLGRDKFSSFQSIGQFHWSTRMQIPVGALPSSPFPGPLPLAAVGAGC